MRRRQLDPSTVALPGWAATYTEADWIGGVDQTDPEFRDLAPVFGTAFMRRVVAHRLWSEACRRWCERHGVTLKEARRRA